MENSVIKSTKAACNLALILWSLYALLFLLRVLRYCGIISFNVYLGIDIAPIEWFSDEAQIAQWIELIGYIFSTILMLFLTIRLILSTRRGIKSNEIFTKSNAKSLMWLSAIVFFHLLFAENLSIIYGFRELFINTTPFVCCLITLIVAMLYKMAVSVSEENRLTV